MLLEEGLTFSSIKKQVALLEDFLSSWFWINIIIFVKAAFFSAMTKKLEKLWFFFAFWNLYIIAQIFQNWFGLEPTFLII